MIAPSCGSSSRNGLSAMQGPSFASFAPASFTSASALSPVLLVEVFCCSGLTFASAVSASSISVMKAFSNAFMHVESSPKSAAFLPSLTISA